MTMVAHYKTKKSLKESIGERLTYQETSMFGPEYPLDGNGTFPVVGPSAYVRKWYAKVVLRDHKIVKVS